MNGSNGHGNGNAIAVSGRRPRTEIEPAVSGGGEGAMGDAGRPAPNILLIVWRQRWLVVLALILAVAGGLVYLAKATPIYASTSVVYVQQSGPKIVGDMMASGQRSNTYIVTQCQVIESTAILRSALAKPGIASLATLRDTSNGVGKLKMIVSAEPDKAGELINVSVESPNAQDAAAIANAVVESYIEYIGQSHKSTAVEVLRILQNESNRLSGQLQTTNDAMLTMKRDNPDLITNATPTVTRGSQVNDELTKAQLRQLDLRTAVVQANAVKDDPFQLKRVLDQFNVTSDNAAVVDPALLAEYRNLRDQLEEMTNRLGPRHDAVLTAQRQLARVEAEVADATRSAATNLYSLLQQAMAATDARVNQLQQEADSIRQGNVELNSKQAEYDQLRATATRLERSLDTLDARMKDINVTEDFGALSVSVLETAQPGGLPVRPQRGKTLAMAVVAGLMVGVGLALLRDTMDHRLRSVDEITATLDVNVLGAVPHIGGRRMTGGGRIGPNDRGRFVHAMPRSAVAESFRTLRTAVYFGMPEGSPGKTILVTSPAPGDGKSTTASNLAIAFAQAGRRVLLIDADCRRPSQHRVWSIAGAPGLADVLAGKATLEQAIRGTATDQLWLMPAGEIPTNPSELLDSPAFRELLATVSEQYDQVIIDSPPIVPVTDARIIAAIADATVLVLRAERSTRRLANHARDALMAVGAHLIGVVVSDVPRGSQSYGYGYYGLGRYGYAPVQVDVGSSGSSANGHARSEGGGAKRRERIAGELMNDERASRE